MRFLEATASAPRWRSRFCSGTSGSATNPSDVYATRSCDRSTDDALIIAVELLHIAFRVRFGRKTGSPRTIKWPDRMQTPLFRATTFRHVCSPYRHPIELLHETSTVSGDGRSRITMRTISGFNLSLAKRSSRRRKGGAGGDLRRESRILPQRCQSVIPFVKPSILGAHFISSLPPLGKECSGRNGVAQRAFFSRDLYGAAYRYIAGTSQAHCQLCRKSSRSRLTANQYSPLYIEMIQKRCQIAGVLIHVIAVPRLARAAVTATIMCNDAIKTDRRRRFVRRTATVVLDFQA